MPQRFLRPGITTSKRWNRCDWASQSLYLRLITLVDDYGRYDADLELIRSHAFPFGDPAGKVMQLPAIARMMQTLVRAPMLILYQVDGKEYLQLLRWQERARSGSRYPEPSCEQMTAIDNKCSTPSPLAISHKPAPVALRYPADAGREFSDVFVKWIDFRKGLGRKPKDWTCLFQEQLDWLSKQPRTQRIEIVSQSIRNGWQGLFPLKQSQNGTAANKSSLPVYGRDRLPPAREPTEEELKTAREIARLESSTLRAKLKRNP